MQILRYFSAFERLEIIFCNVVQIAYRFLSAYSHACVFTVNDVHNMQIRKREEQKQIIDGAKYFVSHASSWTHLPQLPLDRIQLPSTTAYDSV